MSQATWQLDPAHSEINFKVKHLMISNVKGGFSDFSVTVDHEDILHANIKAVIQVSSITTGNADRDNHLKSADFFDVDTHPEMTFTSTHISQDGDDLTVNGDLTIKGITKPIVLSVEYGGEQRDPWGNSKKGYEVSTKIKRSDFGLNWNAALETGGVLVGDEVKIEAEVQFVKQQG